MTACQTYTSAPLETEHWAEAIDARVNIMAPVQAFANRLNRDGHPATIFDPGDGIGPAEGEVLALFYNPELQIKRLENGVALANAQHAGLWEDPVFGFDGAHIVSPSGQPFEWGAGLSFTIPLSGRLDLEKLLADTQLVAAIRELINEEWQIRSKVRRAWATWATAVERERVLLDALRQVQALDQTVQTLHEHSHLNRIERRLFAMEFATVEAAWAQAHFETSELQTMLLDLLGMPERAAYRLHPVMPAIQVPKVDDLTERIINNNTELAVAFAQYAVAEDQLRLEVRKQYPDLKIGSGYGTYFNDRRVMFGLSLPLPVLNGNRRGIATARAGRTVAQARAETTFARIDRHLTCAMHQLKLAIRQRAVFEATLFPLLEEQEKNLQQLADLGEVDLFVLLETTSRRRDAMLTMVDYALTHMNVQIEAAELLGPDRPLPPAEVIVDAPAPTQGDAS